MLPLFSPNRSPLSILLCFLRVIDMGWVFFMRQQRRFGDLGLSNRTPRFSLLLAFDRISFGHTIHLYVEMLPEWVPAMMDWTSRSWIVSLGLEGSKPCLVEIHKNMVAMKPLECWIFPHHNLPIMKYGLTFNVTSPKKKQLFKEQIYFYGGISTHQTASFLLNNAKLSTSIDKLPLITKTKET